MASTKVNLYNLPDLKNTADDAIANYLNSIKFTQSHSLTDTRLALGYSAFALSAACFAWDYHLGFPSTKHITAIAVALYTLLNAALTYWVWFVEDGTIYQGTTPTTSASSKDKKNTEKLYISTKSRRSESAYELKVAIVRPASNGSPAGVQSFKLSKPYTEFFDESGHFVAAPLQQFLASNISVVGKADPKRVKSAADLLNETPGLLDAVIGAAAGDAEDQGVTVTGSDVKGASKRRKA